MDLSPSFEDALVFATQLHASQKRKSTTIPYIAHLLGVAPALRSSTEPARMRPSPRCSTTSSKMRTAIPAVVRAEIRRRFGSAVLAIVDGCTNTDQRPKPDWRPRKEKYIAHLPEASPSIRLVSVSDKLSNARAILSDYREIGEALSAAGSPGAGRDSLVLPGAGRHLWQARPGTPGQELERVVGEIERVVTERELAR